ncbi:MAG: MFS family permease [Alteromonadaceae bacterium]|jgi:MFS family permease
MSVSGLNPLEKRTAVSLAAVFGFRMLGLFMLMPVFAIYGQDLIGFSPIWVGLAIGAYGLTQAILQIPMGMLSDRFGRRRIIVIGLILFAIGSVIAAMADSVYMVTLGRAVQGTGAIASAVLALAADLTREEQRPKVMAVIGMCIGMSFSLALIFGPMLAEAFGLSGLFWVTAMFALAAIVVVVTLVPTAVNKAPRGETVAIPALLSKLIRHPQLVRLDAGVLILHLMLTAVFVSLPQMLMQTGMPAVDHWRLYFPVLIGSFFLMVPFIIYSSKKAKEREVFLMAICGLVISLIGLYFGAKNLHAIMVFVLLFFVAFNYLEATLPALVSRITPPGNKGSAMGIYSSSQFFGAFLGGIIGGVVADLSNPQLVFAAAAVMGVLWLVVAWSMEVPKRSKPLSMDIHCADEVQAELLAEQLVNLTGVLEATVMFEENKAYLKVDEKVFNIELAQNIVNQK